MARGTGACKLVKTESRSSVVAEAATARAHTDRPTGYDRFHRTVATTSYLTETLPSFEQTLARLVETHGSEGAAWVWGYLVEAALDLAAPETAAYPYVRERMRQFTHEYRSYLTGAIAVTPNPSYKPVTDEDAVLLRELTQTLHDGMTSFASRTVSAAAA